MESVEKEIAMTNEEYHIECRRTVMVENEQTVKIATAIGRTYGLSHVIVAALKLNSESGELADAIVRHICYGQPLDITNIKEECGDLLWYISLILDNVESSISEVMQHNIDKLRIRYPEKFTEEAATKRADKV